MTLISVGSTGTNGAANGTPGVSPGGNAAPSGFDELLAGAHPAPDAHRDARETGDASRDPREPCNAADATPAKPAASDESNTDGAAGAGAATTDTSSGDPTPAKPDAAADPAGAIAALALTPPIIPTTPVSLPAVAPTAADCTTTPVADATPPVVDPSAGNGATDPAALPVVDLAAVLANLPTADPAATPEPVLLPLPDLPAAEPTHGSVATNATRESFAAPPPSTEHVRPAPPSAPPVTGAATFAPAPPPAPVSAAVAAATVESTAAAGRFAPPPPSEQLVSVLAPLRTTQNGSYTLRLELKPPELGRVELRVEMRDGVLHASIHAEHHSSAQTLRDAIADLRDRLGAEGIRTGDLTVSDGGVGSGRHESDRTPEARAARGLLPNTDEPDPAGAPPLDPTPDPDTTSLLDVRV